MNEAAGELRKTAAAAISSGRPHRPKGIELRISWFTWGMARSGSLSGVSIHPGAMAFTRTPEEAHSRASVRVRWIMAAFALP